MTDRELRDRLRAIDPDSDPIVEQRAWEVVRAAYRPAAKPRARRHWRVTVPAVASVLALAAGALAAASPPREALVRWLRDAIGLSTAPHPRPMLAGLPGGGQLLVNSPAGPWIVSADGHRHYLGTYRAAAWSPHSLYVVAWRRTQLAALDPRGQLQWTLPTAGGIAAARWSPDGYRIAYTADRALWAVAGDGSGNHALRRHVALVPPAWQPHSGAAHRIAVVDQRGDIELLGADSGVRSWLIKPLGTPRQLLWSPDGTRLLTVAARQISLYDNRGRLIVTGTIPAGEAVSQAAFAHAENRVALIISQANQAGDSVALLAGTPRGLRQLPKLLFSSPERLNEISWSPNDQWILASSPSANQWVFVRTVQPASLEAVSRISSQFQTDSRQTQGFPTLGGWQAPTIPRSGR